MQSPGPRHELARVTSRLHRGELVVGVDLVRRLVAEQFPPWSRLDVRPLHSSGSTNVLFRLGDELLVRMPRQPGGTSSIEQELRWVPWLSPSLPVGVPEVIAIGEPGHGYPERWSVVRWLDGVNPAPATSAPDLARDLADVVAALRDAPVPPEARADPTLRSYRAEPLVAMDDGVRRNLAACRDIHDLDIDLQLAERIWDDAMSLPGQSAAASWVHADLLAENLREGLPVTDDQWLRGRAWALAIALMTFPYYWTTMPERCAHRLVMARHVLADSG